MTEWGAEQFQAFFEAAWGHPPFAWQTALAQRVLSATVEQAVAWPAAIALPTASGKTACLDVAVFALAAQAGARGLPCRAPRRIFFVVDRRVIVDEAHDRAQKLARALAEATDGILYEVAERLRGLAGSDLPLAVQALRGGQPRSDDWAATPLQPTIVASTVDQVGSRLLFRAYGPWSGMWPVHAGLVGNGALILLDEAHCAQPMLQTLQAVQRYRGWAEQPLPVPFEVAVLSATPPAGIEESQVFRDTSHQCRDPDHALGRRQLARKPARLEEAIKAKGRNAAQRRSVMAIELAAHALSLSGTWGGSDAPAVVVFCNRVDTARQVSHLLRKDAKAVHLLTGRMRPIDKDDVIVNALAPLSTSNAGSRQLQTATFVVATQTLEVGADLDFDLLVTECASLDALRQRFGRLNRSGRDIPAAAVIVAAVHDTLAPSDDPVYGNALHATWVWLQEQAKNAASVDFGIAALEPLLPNGDQLALLNAPSPQAPVLLPAHLDLLAQTAPVPEPSPDVSLFLHGPRSGPADVQVCWRADLTTDVDADGLDALLRCQPSAPECLAVPFAQMRRWLDNQPAASGADIEGSSEADEESRLQTTGAPVPPPRRALRWRGREGSAWIEGGSTLRPGDLLVLPTAAGGFDELGTLGQTPIADWGDRANASMRPDAVLRLHTGVIAQWPGSAGRDELLALLTAYAAERWQEDPREFAALLGVALMNWLPELELDLARWSWLHDLVQQAACIPRLDRALMPHPGGGWIVHFRQKMQAGSRHGARAARAFFADEDDAASSGHFRSLLIEPQGDGRSHLGGVGALAGHYAEHSGLAEPMVRALQSSGDGHDLGKADPRFQSLLRNGVQWVTGPLLAKSAELPQGKQAFLAARERAGYPHGGRHELLSVRLLESCSDLLPADPDLRELLLHLVESHHGHCRPFAPVVVDDVPVDVNLVLNGKRLQANSATGLEQMDAGPANRYWRLTRRYGWWGLAWLESLLRLADHRRSEWEQQQQEGDMTERHEFCLSGLRGENPLAFLAALGALRTSASVFGLDAVQMRWQNESDAWQPVLSITGADAMDELSFVDQLHERLQKGSGRQAFAIGDDLTLSPEAFRAVSQKAAMGSQANERDVVDFIAAFGCDGVELVENGKASGKMADTAFRTMSGAGHQHFLGFMRTLADDCKPSHLQRTLFAQWRYDDPLESHTMRWDPSDDVRYALRWRDSSGDPERKRAGTMWGANRLAIEGLPMLPTAPVPRGQLATVGFTHSREAGTAWTWPIWDRWCSIDIVKSMLTLRSLQTAKPLRLELSRLGVAEVFRCYRIRQGKYRNLTPGQSV